jgi:hypothetical protein
MVKRAISKTEADAALAAVGDLLASWWQFNPRLRLRCCRCRRIVAEGILYIGLPSWNATSFSSAMDGPVANGPIETSRPHTAVVVSGQSWAVANLESLGSKDYSPQGQFKCHKRCGADYTVSLLRQAEVIWSKLGPAPAVTERKRPGRSSTYYVLDHPKFDPSRPLHLHGRPALDLTLGIDL